MEARKNSKRAWKRILESERNLTDKEAERMKANAKKLRKEYGFRRQTN